jgi:hypothetical protein
MKLTRIGSFLVALFITLAVNAQNKIYFIEDVTENGEPVGHSNTWAIDPAAGSSTIYMLYTHNKKVIPDSQLTVKIQVLGDDSKYADYSEDIYNIEKGSTYVIFELPFSEAGNYRVTIVDGKKKNLAVESLEIVLAEGAGTEISAEHAKGYKITFCDSVTEEGVPLKEMKEFKLKKGEARVTVYISHPENLLFSDFSIKITQVTPKKEETAEIPLSTDPSYGAVYYEYVFKAAGTYTVALLSASGQILNFETVTIK